MLLYVMRHGPAEDRAPSGRDFDRSLTPMGRDLVRRMAEAFTEAHFALPATPGGAPRTFPRVLTSPRVRARETAAILHAAWFGPPVYDGDEEDEGDRPTPVVAVTPFVAPAAPRVSVVGAPALRDLEAAGGLRAPIGSPSRPSSSGAIPAVRPQAAEARLGPRYQTSSARWGQAATYDGGYTARGPVPDWAIELCQELDGDQSIPLDLIAKLTESGADTLLVGHQPCVDELVRTLIDSGHDDGFSAGGSGAELRAAMARSTPSSVRSAMGVPASSVRFSTGASPPHSGAVRRPTTPEPPALASFRTAMIVGLEGARAIAPNPRRWRIATVLDPRRIA